MLSFFKKFFNKEDIAAHIQNGSTILDVRTPREFQGGHVKGSINIPVDALDKNWSKIQKMKQPIITCCASGMRSGIAAKKIRNKGMESFNGGSWVSVNRLV